MLAAWSRAGMPSSPPPRKSWRGLTLLCLCFSASGRCSTRVFVTMSSPEAAKTWRRGEGVENERGVRVKGDGSEGVMGWGGMGGE